MICFGCYAFIASIAFLLQFLHFLSCLLHNIGCFYQLLHLFSFFFFKAMRFVYSLFLFAV